MIISFNYDKNMIFVIFFILLGLLNVLTSYSIEKYLYIVFPSLSKLSLIIFYLIEKKLNKNNISNQSSSIENNQITYKKFMIIFSSIIFYCAYFYAKIIQKQDLIWGKHTQMCFILLTDFIFFTNERYSHQIFSITFIIILSIIIFVLSFEKFNFIFCFYILSSYSYAFSLLIVKYINTKYFISVYIFGFIFGLLEIILLLIKGISFQFNFTWSNLIYNIGLIGNYYLFYYIIYKLSPNYSIVSQCITRFLFYMWKNFLNKEIIKYLLVMICIIFSLIYLEIIELNFCTFNFNLKKAIIKRGKNEDYTILTYYEDINKDDLISLESKI